MTPAAPTLAQWGTGFLLLGLLWALYVWRPRLGAGAALMLVFGILAWQARAKTGVFAGAQ